MKNINNLNCNKKSGGAKKIIKIITKNKVIFLILVLKNKNKTKNNFKKIIIKIIKIKSLKLNK
jgi:hypothetical protein